MSSVFVERHGKKRKFKAELAHMQISNPEKVPHGGARCVVYYSPLTDDMWVRPEAEFNDRFEVHPASTYGQVWYRHKKTGGCYEKVNAWLWPTHLRDFEDNELVYVLSEFGSTGNKKYLIKHDDLNLLYNEEVIRHSMQDKQKEGTLANRIEISEHKNGTWKAVLQKMTSQTELVTFEVEAPSQTMLLEIIRVVFGMKRSKTDEPY